MELELYVIYQDEKIVKHSFKKAVLIKLAIFELNSFRPTIETKIFQIQSMQVDEIYPSLNKELNS